jgi:hypothetical protein
LDRLTVKAPPLSKSAINCSGTACGKGSGSGTIGVDDAGELTTMRANNGVSFEVRVVDKFSAPMRAKSRTGSAVIGGIVKFAGENIPIELVGVPRLNSRVGIALLDPETGTAQKRINKILEITHQNSAPKSRALLSMLCGVPAGTQDRQHCGRSVGLDNRDSRS